MTQSRRRLRIAYVTRQDPESKRSWSGTQYFMARALQKHCGEVTFLGPAPGMPILYKIINKIVQKVVGKRYAFFHSLSYARKCARFFENGLRGRDYDIVFAPAASTAIALLKTEIPIIYVSDATFALIHNYYPAFTDLRERSILEGNIVERESIRKSRMAIFSSDWAARSAIEYYGANPENVRVIPFGANMENIPPKETVLGRERTNRCKLLFLAVDWARKGGDIAFDTLVKLADRSIDAELIVCGCTPPTGLVHDRMTIIPFLDKDDPHQSQMLRELFLTSDFLLLPTRYDCTPIVFCEANAFGLPVLTTDTGGVSGVIRSGENGFMLPHSSGGEAYADLIAAIFRDERRLASLKCSSRQAFDERLNWDSWALTVKSIFNNILHIRES